MAGNHLVSPGTFRASSAQWQAKILRAIERLGLDHAMYAFVDERGDLLKVVRCCHPAAPCGAESFRIRRNMGPASREVPANLLAADRALAS